MSEASVKSGIIARTCRTEYEPGRRRTLFSSVWSPGKIRRAQPRSVRMTKSVCFVIMPFGRKPDAAGRQMR